MVRSFGSGVLASRHDDGLTDGMFGTLAPGGLRDDGPHHSSEEIAVGAGLASTRQGFDGLVAHGFAPLYR